MEIYIVTLDGRYYLAWHGGLSQPFLSELTAQAMIEVVRARVLVNQFNKE